MKTYLLLLYILFSLTAFAQPPAGFTVSGSVTDSTGQALELATVALKPEGSEKVSAAVTTDMQGKFTLPGIAAGKYTLTCYSVGYAVKESLVEVKADIQLPAIQLATSSKTLKETEIVAQKALVVKTAEKTVYNVSQSPANQVGTAEDVLRNTPGVSVDQNGAISIIGKSGVRVLVDGRPNAFAENNLAAFLKSIPANSIEAIEVITNPSARYDAEGNAGIINIKLKKGKANGLNGNISAGYGYRHRYFGNAGINYRKNKVNFFANYSVDASNFGNRYIEVRDINLNDTITHYRMDSKGRSPHLNNSIKTGLDIFIDDKNTLTYTVGGNYSTSHWITRAESSNNYADNRVISSYISDNDEANKNYTVSNDIAYQKKFDSTGRELNIGLVHTYVAGTSNAPLASLAYDSTGIYSETQSLWRRTDKRHNINNVVFVLDYAHPLKKLPGYKIETGAKNETTLNKNVFDAYQTIKNIERKDTLLSNSFNYTENIAAAYFIFSGSHKKWLSWRAGLRGEHTYIRSNNNSVNRQYFSLFPSASADFTVKEGHSIGINYSRRIQRPEFRQINNSITFIDQYSTWQGNPNLQPAFSHVTSLSYSAMVKQHIFNMEVVGFFQNGGFIESSRIDTVARITRGGNTNGADSKQVAFNFYTKLQLTKWWTLQMNHSYSYTHYSYKAGINTGAIAGHLYNLWGSMAFKFWKNTHLEINGWYNTGGVQSQGISLPVGMLNASLKKSFFKDRFTVAIAGNNILNTMNWRWTVSNNNLETVGSWRALNRNVSITLSYQFGANNNTQRREREGNSRLGGGSGGR